MSHCVPLLGGSVLLYLVTPQWKLEPALYWSVITVIVTSVVYICFPLTVSYMFFVTMAKSP